MKIQINKQIRLQPELNTAMERVKDALYNLFWDSSKQSLNGCDVRVFTDKIELMDSPHGKRLVLIDTNAKNLNDLASAKSKEEFLSIFGV